MDGSALPLRRIPGSPYAGPADVTLDAQQLATVRAALEWYVQSGLGDYAIRPEDIHQLATAHGAYRSLDDVGLVKLQGLLDDAKRVTFRRTA